MCPPCLSKSMARRVACPVQVRPRCASVCVPTTLPTSLPSRFIMATIAHSSPRQPAILRARRAATTASASATRVHPASLRSAAACLSSVTVRTQHSMPAMPSLFHGISPRNSCSYAVPLVRSICSNPSTNNEPLACINCPVEQRLTSRVWAPPQTRGRDC